MIHLSKGSVTAGTISAATDNVVAAIDGIGANAGNAGAAIGTIGANTGNAGAAIGGIGANADNAGANADIIDENTMEGKTMSSGNDWIPHREQDLVNLMELWIVMLGNAPNRTAFGWPTELCEALEDLMHQFIDGRYEYSQAPTKENKVIKDEAKKAAIKEMRLFAAQFVRNNHKMNDAQRVGMGVPVADPKPSPAPVPLSWPISHYGLNTQNEIHITSENSSTQRKSLPDGVRWIEHSWIEIKPNEPIPAPLPNVATFNHFETWTKPSESMILRYDLDMQRGAIIHTSRYSNTRGKAGPWAPVKVVTIP